MVDPRSEWFWESASKYAVEGMKTLLLLNGGAALAIMAFFDGRGPDGLRQVAYGLISFGVGAALSSVVFMLAYLAQLQYGNGNRHWATRWHFATYVAAGFSLAAFLAGIFMVAFSIGWTSPLPDTLFGRLGISWPELPIH